MTFNINSDLKTTQYSIVDIYQKDNFPKQMYAIWLPVGAYLNERANIMVCQYAINNVYQQTP